MHTHSHTHTHTHPHRHTHTVSCFRNLTRSVDQAYPGLLCCVLFPPVPPSIGHCRWWSVTIPGKLNHVTPLSVLCCLPTFAKWWVRWVQNLLVYIFCSVCSIKKCFSPFKRAGIFCSVCSIKKCFSPFKRAGLYFQKRGKHSKGR